MRKKRRKKSKHSNFKLNPKLVWMGSFVVAFVIVAVGMGYLVYSSDMFKIKGANIQSNVPLSSNFKRKIEGQSLFALDIDSLVSQLLKEYPEYKQVCILKKFPSSITIDIQKRKPFAQIKGKRFYPVDNEAVILDEGEVYPYEHLIPIEIQGRVHYFKKGAQIEDQGLEYAFDLIKVLREADVLNEFRVELINSTKVQALYFIMVQKESVHPEADVGNPIKVIVGGSDFRKKIGLLKELINEKLADKIGLVKYIDLRYKKIYVGFKR